jgi:hypothetical protein
MARAHTCRAVAEGAGGQYDAPPMHVVWRWAVCLVFCLTLVSCARKIDPARPFATPTITPSRSQVLAGHLVDLRYQFAVAADAAPVTEPYSIFVHVVDEDGQGVWTDDHEPSVPTQEWKPGARVEYSRPLFIPRRAWAGRFHVDIGLYSPRTGERLPLAAPAVGGRAYRVASFEVAPAGDIPVVAYFKGWHEEERVTGPGSRLGLEWHWSTRESVLWCPRPQGNGQFVLRVDQPIAGASVTRTVQISIGGQVIDSFSLAPDSQVVRRVMVPSALLGSDDIVPITLAVDKTVVPAQVSGSGSTDSRELGVRVLDAFLEPI